MGRIDQLVAPQVDALALAALVAYWHRCPEFSGLDIADLVSPTPDSTKQISLQLPDKLHERLKRAADRNRRSLHAEILWRLEQDQEGDER